MDLVRVGRLLRAIRVSRRERLIDIEARSHVSRSEISRIERAQAHALPETYDRLARSLGASIEMYLRWPDGDLDRLLNAAHSAMHERIGRLFARLTDWVAVPEVTFAVGREVGSIDWLAWHAGSRSLLIVEIKTALIDVQAVLAQVDRYVRLGRVVARERGWKPLTVSVWLVFEDSTRNRLAVRRHRAVLGARFPVGGHALRGWLRAPTGTTAALSFLSDSRGKGIRPKRVRLRGDERPRRDAVRAQTTVAASVDRTLLPRGGNGAGVRRSGSV
jgi:transcriptional regulator with XRE-family HTH domain